MAFNRLLLFLLLHLPLFFIQFPVFQCCHDHERTALLSVKSFLTDPSGRLSSWRGENCCEWIGIRCSNSSYITFVDLRNPEPVSLMRNLNSVIVSRSTKSTSLNGTISPSLFTLNHLTYLDLSFNKLYFSNIDLFCNLTNLIYLNLSNSMFSGSITSQFANFSLLHYLDISCSVRIPDFSSFSFNFSSSQGSKKDDLYYLSSSHISSRNLSWLRGLVNLKVLMLSGVDLSIASLAKNWAEPISLLANLRELVLSDCNISSPVPIKDFLNLSRLSFFRMDFNFLNSQIPIQLANLTSLSILDFTSSHLQGSIPYLPQLQHLYVASNPDLSVNLTWMFESPWPNLQVLFFQSTKVGGPVPHSISNASLLVYLIGSSCSIQGSLPTSISNLSQLQYLDLSFNNITSYLPSSISNLKNLRRLSLFQNHLQGPIPKSLCEISSLRFLHLGSNNFTGRVPDCFGKLVKLETFFITENSMEGTISLKSLFQESNPISIGLGSSGLDVKLNENSLPPNFQPEILELHSCKLKGYIPAFICNLTNLAFLDLAANKLTGTIPSCLFKLPNLSYLDLSHNNLQGTLPHSIHLTSNFPFTVLNLAANDLRGPLPLPPENLEVLDLSKNRFTGEISSQLVERLSSAVYVSFALNELSGSIPNSICSSNHVLRHLDLSNNKLSGKIPSSLEYCDSLISLNLGVNYLTGNFLDEPKQLKNLKALQLHQNKLNGPFPSFVRHLQQLQVLNLGNNLFEGPIPSFIGDLHKLQILVLRSNAFNGSIPKEITHLRKLQFLDLASNKLSGQIPNQMTNLEMLTSRPNKRQLLGFEISLWYSGVQLEMVSKGIIHHLELVFTYNSGIDLSLNNLVGSIPEEMGLLRGLYMLNLSHNHLSGGIPMSVGKMIGLESLDLSFNNLTGEIPQSLTWIDFLQYLNLSYNNLTGRIPRGNHFETLSLDGSAYIGNVLLCGVPTNKNCEDEHESSFEDEDQEENAREIWILFGAVVSGFGVGFWGLFLILLVGKEKWRSWYWRCIDILAVRLAGFIIKKKSR